MPSDELYGTLKGIHVKSEIFLVSDNPLLDFTAFYGNFQSRFWKPKASPFIVNSLFHDRKE